MVSTVKELSELEEKINYTFKDKGLLNESLTHASSVTFDGELQNERLEFVGDAVLDLVIAGALFEMYPDKDAGWLTQVRASLVNEESLQKKADEIDLGSYLIVGKAEEVGGGRAKPSILAGAYEALLGAILLDGGYEAVESFILVSFSGELKFKEDHDPKDYKSRLQERLQKSSMPMPVYKIISTSGPDHKKIFVCSVSVEGKELGRGSGSSKKEAELEAAKDALAR
jgi:ribonuclease-3